jgi:hypothetical protein
MHFRFLFIIMVALTGPLLGALPMRDGESFTYKVSWAVLPGAGEIKVTAAAGTAGEKPVLNVVTTTQTKGFARMLLPFDAKAESIFDVTSGHLVSMSESSHQRDKTSAHAVTFDYAAGQALYSRPTSTEPPRPLPMPAGEPLDLITCLVHTRDWDLKPGETRDALVLFDDDFYELTVHAARYEPMRTAFGTLDTVVLEPRMDKTAPKGMFKKGSSVRVWISRDERRLPVRFEVEFKIGTGVATLIQYTGGTPIKEAKQ